MHCTVRMKLTGWLHWRNKAVTAAIGTVWREVQARLEVAHDVAGSEGKQLVKAVLELDDMGLIMGADAPFPIDKADVLETLVARRMAGEPLAQVIGYTWFYGRRWRVTPDVLIPRPDTEVLVEAVLERIGMSENAYVAEVGVGSGAIVGSVLVERPEIRAFGVDISEQAARICEQNLAELGMDAQRWRIEVRDGLDGVQEHFNLIMSNPPYVTDEEWEGLEAEVKDFEPRLALTGGVPNPDGLVFYRRLAAWGRDLVQPRGWLCMEVGWQQAQAVRELLEQHVEKRGQQEGDVWCEISVTKDLAGRGRVVCARRC